MVGAWNSRAAGYVGTGHPQFAADCGQLWGFSVVCVPSSLQSGRRDEAARHLCLDIMMLKLKEAITMTMQHDAIDRQAANVVTQ